MGASFKQALLAHSCDSLCGRVKVPGDKSVSHRSLMIASQALGESKIYGLLEGEDVLRTRAALEAMGVDVRKDSDGVWCVRGVGVGGLSSPDVFLDMGNAGTGVRLMMGLAVGARVACTFVGDASLSKRPMRRVGEPLELMGAVIASEEDYRLPVTIAPCDTLLPIEYVLPIPSAQVKSAILLAGLSIPGETVVVEPEVTRDHTERMLRYFGADVRVSDRGDGGRRIVLTGCPELQARTVEVPGDPSSSAFLVVAALLIPGSDLCVEHVCVDPERIGLYVTLQEMGGDVVFENVREVSGEKVADIRVRYSVLNAVSVPAERAPSMIDEYPILSIAAAFAKGTTVMHGLSELKVKESNRLQAILDGLCLCGVEAFEEGDVLEVVGADVVRGGCEIVTHMDHRIAMSFLIMGLVSEEAVSIDDSGMIATSFPGFVALMKLLGARIEVVGEE